MATKYPMPQWGGQKAGEGETVSCGTNVIVIAADVSDVTSFAAHG